jgi:hypothetical protein
MRSRVMAMGMLAFFPLPKSLILFPIWGCCCMGAVWESV